MRRSPIAIALTAAAMLAPAACGQGDGLPEADDGTDYDTCFEGTCTVLVTEGAEVEIDESFQVGTVSVESINDDTVDLEAAGGGLSFTLAVDTTGNFQGLLIVEVLGIEGDEAVLRFYPA